MASGRAEILDALGCTIFGDLLLLRRRKLEAAQQIERVFDREVVVLSGQARGAIDLVELAHLEFGAVGPSGNRGIDQRNGAIEVAIVVVADLGNDVAGLAVAEEAVADAD